MRTRPQVECSRLAVQVFGERAAQRIALGCFLNLQSVQIVGLGGEVADELERRDGFDQGEVERRLVALKKGGGRELECARGDGRNVWRNKAR